MRVIQEFREFAIQWNVADLAVGVVIGGAFGKIVSSLVSDIIMPIIGFLTAGVDIKDLAYKFQAPSLDGNMKMIELKWGMFLQTMIDFVIIAFAIFIFIKIINRATKRKPKTETIVTWPTDIELLTEIRDLLKK